MARLAHMGIMCKDPERLREFYMRWFGLEEILRTPSGTIHLTDGTTNMGLMKQGSVTSEENQKLGLHHIGFEVQSIAEFERLLKEFDPDIRIEERPNKDPYAQLRVIDPEGIPVDISEKGYGVGTEKRIPGIRHMATACMDGPRQREFYVKVFGMRDTTRTEEDRIRQGSTVNPGTPGKKGEHGGFLGDGFINLALNGWPSTQPGKGFNHFGFLVRNPVDLMYKIAEAEGTRIDQRPPDRFAEYRIWDPEDNTIDLTEKKGFKVDVNQTDRIED